MDRHQTSAEDLLRRLALDYYFGAQDQAPRPEAQPRTQSVPINVYETDEDIVLVAPMPGVEADNIEIQVLKNTVTLRASLRGPGQRDREYLLHEWTYGPYERTVTLPMEVDAEHANASHGNGVLVLSLPKSNRSRSVRVPLRQVTASEATHRGHSGHHTSRRGLRDDDSS
jgi:HSP20 family protein